MATRAKEATAKDAIATNSNGSLLRSDVAPLRTAEQIIAKNEQIQDGLERDAISPKRAEQMSQCIKVPISLARLEMGFLRMIQGFGRKVPVPRSPLLRSAIGLPPAIAPTDGEVVRALLPEK